MHKKLAFPLWFVLVDEPVREPIQQPEEMSLRSSNPTEYHEYIYASGRLMRETITTTDAEGNDTTEVLDFIYGSGSTPLALIYTTGTATPVTYYYITNIQGDVVKLVSAGGTVAASYTYDAWGRVTSATGDMAEVNPIRYRGYYYDAETKLYYLQSRYYDPAVRRFMNADGVASTGQGFVGFNMFLYCLNNPISMYDSDGWCSKFLLWKIDCGKKNCKDSEAYDPSTPRIAILYDGNMNSYFNGRIGDRGFRDQGKCFIGIFGIHEALGNCTVEDYAYTNMDEFVDSWNSLSGEYTAILAHPAYTPRSSSVGPYLVFVSPAFILCFLAGFRFSLCWILCSRASSLVRASSLLGW